MTNAVNASLTRDFEVFLVVERIDNPLPGEHWSRRPHERGFAEVESVDGPFSLQDLPSAFDGGERIQSIYAVCSVPPGKCAHEEFVHDSTLGNVEIGASESVSAEVLAWSALQETSMHADNPRAKIEKNGGVPEIGQGRRAIVDGVKSISANKSNGIRQDGKRNGEARAQARSRFEGFLCLFG